ncbi:MAG: hypothetical protein J6J66_01040, partial [Clostridia bacterium]|nr:hypothetical protein [Clostridia bacterium]
AKATSDTPYFLRALREKQFSTVFPSFTLEVHQKKKRHSLRVSLLFDCGEQGLEGAAAQSGLPVDVRDRSRPRRVGRAANRVPNKTLRSNILTLFFGSIRVLRRLENIVASRVAKATSDTPYFLRALREKQFSTVFPSFTPEVHQKKKRHSSRVSLLFDCGEQGLEAARE